MALIHAEKSQQKAMSMDLQELLGRDVDLVVDGTLCHYAAETANRDKILIYERKKQR